MKPYLNALQFLSLLPLKAGHPATPGDFAKVIAAFPLAGLTIGLFLSLAYMLFSLVLPSGVTAVLTVLLMAALTGGMHLDGLADTADGLASGTSRERTLEIMRDSRIGSMGVIALSGCLMLKAALIAAIPASIVPAALILMPGVGKWSMVFPMKFFPYARDEGKAKVFLGSVTTTAAAAGTLVTLGAAAFFLHLAGVGIAVAACLTGYLAARRINARLNGITGDVLGAVNEVSETAFLMFVVIAAARGAV